MAPTSVLWSFHRPFRHCDGVSRTFWLSNTLTHGCSNPMTLRKYKQLPKNGLHLPTEPRLHQDPVHGRCWRPRLLRHFASTWPTAWSIVLLRQNITGDKVLLVWIGWVRLSQCPGGWTNNQGTANLCFFLCCFGRLNSCWKWVGTPTRIETLPNWIYYMVVPSSSMADFLSVGVPCIPSVMVCSVV